MSKQNSGAPARLAIVGGGSQFVPSIFNGLVAAMGQAPRPFAAEVALFDVRQAAAERMARYGALVARMADLPLTTIACGTRAEALTAADLVLLCVSLPEERRRGEALAQTVGINPHEDDLGGIALALSIAPFCLALGIEMQRLCPQALFLDLVNPTDILATIVQGHSGVRSVGLCVEVEGLRGLLAYHLGLAPDELELDHVGINHDGWVLRMRVGDRDAYPLWQRVQPGLEDDPAYHPQGMGGLAVCRLTGYLRASTYHNLPYRFADPAGMWERVAQDWPEVRALHDRAVDEALATDTPIVDPWPAHPARSPLSYPGTGRQIGRLLRAVGTGLPYVSALQVQNRGAIAGWPDDVTVEVPVLVEGCDVRPLAMGMAPEWLCGGTRLVAIQRRLVSEYALRREPALLRQALAATPWAAETRALEAYARELHCRYGEWLAAEV